MGEVGQKVYSLYGLVGYPVKHSYSATMHNAAFEHFNMPARYELFEVAPEKIEEFFKVTVPAKLIRGFNVTVPHKETVLTYLNGTISPMAKMVGAVNTVRVEPDGCFSGFNTDEPGFGKDLNEKGIDLSGKRVILLGAGGAAKAVALALGALHMQTLEIFDKVDAKAQGLAERVRKFYPAVDVRVVSGSDALSIEGAGMLVNATPVGMKEGDPVLVPPERLSPDMFVYDLVYNPSQTPLLKAAEAKGCRWSNGLGMLLHQGCLAFDYWTGHAPPVDMMRDVLENHVYGR